MMHDTRRYPQQYAMPPGDSILDYFKARVVTIIASSASSLTIIACYVIAVSLGHVPAWLPMISDCAVNSPESYLFRLGMISSAVFLQLNSVLMLFFLNSYQFGGRRASDVIALVIVSVACSGFAIVGAVNEKENGTLHGASAIVFFVGYEIYMIMITQRLWSYKGSPRVSNFSALLKLGLTSFCGVALILFAFMSGDQSYYHIPIAVCEWLGVACIIAFNLSYCLEYGQTLDLAALFLANGPPTTRGIPQQQFACHVAADGTPVFYQQLVQF